MRLLHVDDLHFEEFFDSEIPLYAILSHRWSKDEVSYKDFVKGRKQDSIGYKKIVGFCGLIRQLEREIQWVWVDTCCIDKRSSAELTEAINSMYKWYEKARVCIVHLTDVPDAKIEVENDYELFSASDWWPRGWTLQELLAPWYVLFYDAKWTLIGTKAKLASRISNISGIPITFLEGESRFSRFSIDAASVADRMSWASNRRTSRVEDMAYSLLGIFDVNLPLLYGEGERAFRRLQEEIIRTSSDHSILRWGLRENNEFGGPREPRMGMSAYLGCLARSPTDFRRPSMVITDILFHASEDVGYSVTNRGLQMEIDYIVLPSHPRVKYAVLHHSVFLALSRSLYSQCYYRSPELIHREMLLRWLPASDPQVQDGDLVYKRETVVICLQTKQNR